VSKSYNIIEGYRIPTLFFYIYFLATRERRVVARLNLLPEPLDLSLYAGDGIQFRMICTNVAGAPVDISGDVKAQIRVKKDDPDPPVVTFSVNTVDASIGIIYLSLTGAQTQALMSNPAMADGRFIGVWDVQWTKAGSQPRTICVGQVEVVGDVTR
jgi:hypothetical protein